MPKRNSKSKAVSTSDVLTFDSTQIQIIDKDGKQWLTAGDISRALGYKTDNSVSTLYNRNEDEFDDSMTCIVKLTMQGQRRETRVFNQRGCQLIALLARTPKSKAFRKWVLDVLAGQQPEQPAHQTPRIEDRSISYVIHKLEGSKVIESNVASAEVVQALSAELFPHMLLINRGSVKTDLDDAMGIMQQAVAKAAQSIQPFQLMLEDDDMGVAINKRIKRCEMGAVA